MDALDYISMINRQQQELDRIAQEVAQELSASQPQTPETQETRDLTRSVLNLVYTNVGKKEKEKVIVKDEVEQIEAKRLRGSVPKAKAETASGSADKQTYDDPESTHEPKGPRGRPYSSEEAKEQAK